MPKLTVSIPIYNKEAYLAEAIESVLNQSFHDFELLLIDDCSTDRSLEIAKEYANKDQRIIVVENKENLGNIGNGNRCIDLANTDLVVRVDADDVMSSYRLQKQFEWMEAHPNCILLSGVNQTMGTNNRVNIIPQGDENNFNYLFPFKNPISQPCTIFRKSLLEKHEIRYDENGPKIGEDWLLFFKASKKGKIGFHNEIVNQYRLHEDNISKARDEAYFDDIKSVMKYIFDSYNITVKNEESLLFFKQQMNHQLNEQNLYDYKIMKEEFINKFIPKFVDNRSSITQELKVVQQWLFLKSIYHKKLKSYKKVFGIKPRQYAQYLYHQYIKK